jgi:hypothetical protein
MQAELELSSEDSDEEDSSSEGSEWSNRARQKRCTVPFSKVLPSKRKQALPRRSYVADESESNTSTDEKSEGEEEEEIRIPLPRRRRA